MYRVLIERPNYFQKKCRHPVILLFQRGCSPLVVPPEIPCPKLLFPQPVNSNSMLVCESGSRRVRLWEQRRPNLGRARADALLYGINLARKELSHPALFLFAFMLPLVSSCFILAKAILLTREIFWAALFFFFWLSSLNETSNCQCRLFSIPQCFLATLSMVSASIGNEVI